MRQSEGHERRCYFPFHVTFSCRFENYSNMFSSIFFQDQKGWTTLTPDPIKPGSYIKRLKRLGEQWTQHTVRGAFWPTILPIEKSARELRAWLCLGKSNHSPLSVHWSIKRVLWYVFQTSRSWVHIPAGVGFSQTQPGTHACIFFNGQDSWSKGTLTIYKTT